MSSVLSSAKLFPAMVTMNSVSIIPQYEKTITGTVVVTSSKYMIAGTICGTIVYMVIANERSADIRTKGTLAFSFTFDWPKTKVMPGSKMKQAIK